MAQTREFHLGDVLSVIIINVIVNCGVTVERAGLSEKERIIALVGFLTGRNDWFERRSVATIHSCRIYLLRKFPQFATPEMDGAVEDLDREIKAVGGGARAEVVGACWLEKQKVKYGEYLAVESMV